MHGIVKTHQRWIECIFLLFIKRCLVKAVKYCAERMKLNGRLSLDLIADFTEETVTCVQLDAVNLEKEQNFLKTGFFSRHRLVVSGCLAQMLLPQARG